MSNICNKISTETCLVFNQLFLIFDTRNVFYLVYRWNLVFKSLLFGKIGPIFLAHQKIIFFWSEKKELIIKWTGFVKCFRGICFENKSVGGCSTLFVDHKIIRTSKKYLLCSKCLFFLEIIWEKQQNINKDHHYE